MRWRSYRTILIFSLLYLGLLRLADGAEPLLSFPEQLDSATTTALATEIDIFTRDLENLRRFMGAPPAKKLNIGVSRALPRDIYFQTLTLWQGITKLLFEISRIQEFPPIPPTDSGTAALLERLRSTRQIQRQILQNLLIQPSEEVSSTPTPSTTALFNTILDTNRQLNLLLERHITPSDVYQAITVAIGYAARLLARYPDAVRIPPEPLFEPNKQPKDVYQRLMVCLQHLSRLFQLLKLPIIEIDSSKTDFDAIQPSDVYLIASMIVSQLDFLYQMEGISKAPPQSVYPGLKFPAHTYQRAGILEAQLRQIERFLTNDPAVLTPPSTRPYPSLKQP